MLVSPRDQFELTGRAPQNEAADADRVVAAINQLAKAITESRPTVQVASPTVNVSPPDVQVAAPNVTVQAPREERKIPEWDVTIIRDASGKLSRFRFKPIL